MDSLSDIFYLPLNNAHEELLRRRESHFLLEKVRENMILTPELESITEKPHLVMFRQLLTPLNEIIIFLKLAKKYNLEPLVIEYFDDKFVSTGNKFKRGLGKMPIHKISDKHGNAVIEFKTIVDFNSFVGKPLNVVESLRGERLIDLHHDLFYRYTNIKHSDIAKDGSSWFKKFHTANGYYLPFLHFFLRDAILFETFLTEGPERDLTLNIVLPAFTHCSNEFGVRPLVVKAADENVSSEISTLDFYPHEVGDILLDKGYI